MKNKLWERQKNGYLKYLGDDDQKDTTPAASKCEGCENLTRAYGKSFCYISRNPEECNTFYYPSIYNQYVHYWNDKNRLSGWNLSNEQFCREYEILKKNYPAHEYHRAVTFEIVIEQTLF